MADPKLSGAHKPDVGKVHGKVKDGSCNGCGADFLGPKNIVKSTKDGGKK